MNDGLQSANHGNSSTPQLLESQLSIITFSYFNPWDFFKFVGSLFEMLGAEKYEPLDCRMLGVGGLMGGYGEVLDLRIMKEVEEPRLDVGWGWGEPGGGGSSPASSSADESALSPTLAITNRVLAAAGPGNQTRPFKAYPKDPLALSAAHNEAYVQFRERMMAQVRANNKGPKKRPASPNNNHPTSSSESPPEDGGGKDAAYWERRRKNNEAAKRSRDARRQKEDEIAIRAAFLEQENLKLRYQIAALTDETAKLRCMLYNS